MRHPTDGVLRRLIDEPAGVAEADRVHVAGCRPCLTEVAGMQQDAALVDAALVTGDAPSLDVDAGWQRLSKAGTRRRVIAPSRAQTAPSRPGRARAMLRRPIVAVAV